MFTKQGMEIRGGEQGGRLEPPLFQRCCTPFVSFALSFCIALLKSLLLWNKLLLWLQITNRSRVTFNEL